MNCPYLSGKHCNFMSRNPTYSAFLERFWRYVPQIATVGLVGGFWTTAAIGAPEEPAGFWRKLGG